MSDLTEIDGNRMRFHFHPGQMKAWDSKSRWVLVLAGTQGGKTSFGPIWLYREIQKRGPGDYLVITPTFPLLSLKALPEFLRLFKSQLQVGSYVGSPSKRFTFSSDGSHRTFGYVPPEPTNIYFGHAQDPDSLESATAKGAWLDEAGQKKFRLGSWEAIQRRLAIHQGRALITTTPYDLGWLKQKLHDPWEEGKKSGLPHPEIDVIRFDSTTNPAFPKAELERIERELPRWKVDLFYRGIFTRPAGLIYDCFDLERHTCPPFAIPDTWKRHLGLDFGGVNTAGIFLAEEPKTGRLFAYREYLAGGRTAAEHAVKLKKGEPGIPNCAGGSGSEDQWRGEFRAAGLPVKDPGVREVEVGIDRVYGAFQTDQIVIFAGLSGLLDELGSYSRILDEAGDPTEKIEAKETYHRLDALRYILSRIRKPTPGGRITVPEKSTMVSTAPEGVFRQ